jgi:hypothetical protein
MPAEFVAYIDESGDEGFNFGGGSTEWFVLAAVIVEKATDLETVKLLDSVRATLGLAPKKGLHFRDLKHQQRLPYVAAIAGACLCGTAIFVHKPSLREQATFRAPNRLYFYTARYLLERISWYCARQRPGPVGHAEIIFSNRSSMSYSDMQDYFRLLRLKATSIDWSVIHPGEIGAYSPMRRMGLQIADAVATSFFYAVEPRMYGFTEPRYARMLKPIVYCTRGNYRSYGLKFVPTDCQAMLDGSPHLDWVKAY